MRSRALVLLLLLAPAVTGCSGDDAEPADAPGLPSQAALRSYFEAVVTSDVDALAEVGADVAGEGSPAQDYAAYNALSAAASAAGGPPQDAVEVEAVDGGFRACVAEDRCAEWSDLEGADGRLTGFTVNGVPLEESLVDLTGQPPVESPGLYAVQPEYAYRPPSGYLNVVVTVTADAAVTPRAGTYIVTDDILDGEAPTPATVEAGSSAAVLLPFPGAEEVGLDGQVTFGLGLDGGTEETVGFGLAAPAS